MKFLAVVSAAIVASSLISLPVNAEVHVRAASASSANVPVSMLGFAIDGIDPSEAKPGPIQCPADGAKGNVTCVTNFVKACGKGYVDSVSEPGGKINMFCK